MARHNDDYIPTYADIEHERDERLKRLEGKADPQKTYLCKYTIEGKPFEEKVVALDLKSAEEKLKQQWGLCGCIPRDLVTVAVDATNVEVK